MTEKERVVIQQLMQRYSFSGDEINDYLPKLNFLKDFSVDVVEKPDYVLHLLEQSYDEQNADDVEYSLFIAGVFKLFSNKYVNILCRLIESDWHYRHEDMANLLKQFKSPDSVNSLFKAALAKYEYLSYSDAAPLAVKCIWALGGIKSSEAREKLKFLTEVDNEIIRENAVKQLERQ